MADEYTPLQWAKYELDVLQDNLDWKVCKPAWRRNNRRIEGAQRRWMAEMAVRYPLEHPAHASVVQAEIELAGVLQRKDAWALVVQEAIRGSGEDGGSPKHALA